MIFGGRGEKRLLNVILFNNTHPSIFCLAALEVHGELTSDIEIFYALAVG